MTKLGVRLVNIDVARHSKVWHFANHSLGQQDIACGQVPVDDLAKKEISSEQEK